MNRRLLKITLCGIALLCGIAVFVSVYPIRSYFGATFGTARIVNDSSEVIASLKVSICKEVFEIHQLAPTNHSDIRFKINSDSHYSVQVRFASGKQLDREVGYVTHGIASADTLLIRSEDVQLTPGVSRRGP